MEKVTELEQLTIAILPNSIDEEWLCLILEAKRLGLTKEEVRHFLCNK
ncbi:anti-repressor SinI family protein [Robertmurraya massiliosenegalensis]